MKLFAPLAFVVLPLLFGLTLIVSVFPVVYVLSGVSVLKVYQAIYMYFRKKPFAMLWIFIFFLAVSFGFSFIEGVVQNYLPGNVISALLPLLGGFKNVFLIYGLVLFFLSGQQISEVV
jgi:hypothetical protein